jgi:hypothetical protein
MLLELMANVQLMYMAQYSTKRLHQSEEKGRLVVGKGQEAGVSHRQLQSIWGQRPCWCLPQCPLFHQGEGNLLSLLMKYLKQYEDEHTH